MDDAPLRDRLQALEARVAQLEQLLGERAAAARSSMPPPPAVTPQAAPPPAPALPPLPERPAARPATHIVEPPPLPPADRSFAARAVPPAPARDLERFVGLAVLGRVGIAALLLAAAYFGQLGWTYLGPGARAAIVYASGLAVVGVGFVLRPRVDAKYTALLWGLGTALTYVAGVLAHLRYEVISSGVAIVALLASAALGQLLAHQLRLEMLATVALLGAYAAPVLVGTPSPTPTAFFTLLLALHAWAAWTEHRWAWHRARAVAVIATVLLVIGWYGRNGIGPLWPFVWHVEAVWLLLIAPELIAAWRGRGVSELRAAAAGLGALAAHASLFQQFSAPSERSFFPVGAACALLVGGALLQSRSAALGTWLARAGAIALPFGVLLAFTRITVPMEYGAGVQWWCLGGLLAAAALLAAVRRWTRTGDLGMVIAALFALAIGATGQIGRERTAPMLAMGLLLLAAGAGTATRAIGLVVAIAAAFAGLHPFGPFGGEGGSWQALAFAIACGAATVALFVGTRVRDQVLAALAAIAEAALLARWLMIAVASPLRPANALPLLWNARAGALAAIVALALGGRALLPAADAMPRAVLGATALAGTFAGGLLELLDFGAGWSPGARDVATSLYTLAFAGALLAAGFRRMLPALRWTALVMFGVAALKVVVWDLRNAETPLRVLATGVLGGVLLLAAWAYARRQRRAGDQASS